MPHTCRDHTPFMFCVSRGQSPTIINPFPNKHRLTPTARPLPAVAQRQPHVKPSHRTHKRGAWLFEAVRISDGLHRVPACLTYHLRTVVRDGWRRKLLGDGLKLQRDPFQLALSSGGRYVCRMHQRAPCFDCVQRLCEPRHASHTPSSDDRRTTPGHAHGLPVAHAHARAGRGVASRGILCHASCALPRVAGERLVLPLHAPLAVSVLVNITSFSTSVGLMPAGTAAVGAR